MAAVSFCLLLLQPYWTIQNDNLACGSNSDWTGPSLTEGEVQPPGFLCLLNQYFPSKPSLIFCTIYFSRVSFIQHQHCSLYPKSQSPVAKRKGRFFGGDLKRGLNSRSAVWCKQEKAGVKLGWERRQWMDPEKGHRWGKVDEVWHVGKREQRTEPIQAPPHCIKQLPAFALQFLEAQLKSCCPGVGTTEHHSQGFRNQRILGWLLIITIKTHKCWGWADSTNNNSFFPPEFRIDWKTVSGIRQMKIYQSSDVITNKGQAGDCILIRLDQLA